MKKQYLTSILVFLLGLTGCMREDWGNSGGPNIPEHGFILNYSVESVVTRATEPATEQENTINSMFILFFEPSAQGTGKFIDIYIVPLEESVINGEFSSISIDFTDDKYTALQTSDEYNMLVAANTEDYSRAADFSGDPDDLDLLREYFNQVLDGRTENQVLESTYLRLDNGIVF
ncbi:MAG: hypothetical protein LIP01_10030 [Tannerellaceae bacterium]|nr:hypothetical protein [Tannerellaceae bacterium]